jgi:hypothetical protein
VKIGIRSRLQKLKVNWHSQMIPMRSADYFAKTYSCGEIQADDRLAKSSVIRAPKDLE